MWTFYELLPFVASFSCKLETSWEIKHHSSLKVARSSAAEPHRAAGPAVDLLVWYPSVYSFICQWPFTVIQCFLPTGVTGTRYQMQVWVGYRYFLFSPVQLVFLSSLRATLAVLCSTTASWWASLPTEEESVVSWKSLEFTPSSRTTPSGLTASWAHRPPRHRNQAVK